MCGIIGIQGKNASIKYAKNMLEKIKHRGTSLFEIDEINDVVLGNNRLPIVDALSGKQPQFNEDKTIMLVLNGEIFNHKTLRNELIKKGHIFSTQSDTEVLVHLYEEYGERMVNMLDSEMFAFIIYDTSNENLFVVRDPLGVKPLYYTYDKNDTIFFASEMKSLINIDGIDKVYNFPAGHYFKDGTFYQYFSLEIDEHIFDKDEAVHKLTQNIVHAVKKRVDTDLPIAVFLSGGVDSSLVMEIATRYHHDVTALILGYTDSPDFEYALRLCKEKNYKYHIIRPDEDFIEEVDDVIYHLEHYEPNIVRHSFANNIISREAQKLGFTIALVGEGSDEIFAGYNQFSFLSGENINKGCKMMTESLHEGNLLRVDKMAMKHTIEIRTPFLDREVVETAMAISGDLKINRDKHFITTKYILRLVAKNFLPDYIALRYKLPFANGAGMNIGYNYKHNDGMVLNKHQLELIQTIPSEIKNRYQHITTDEGLYYLYQFYKNGFTKLVDSEKTQLTKDNLSDFNKSSKKKTLLIAEFDRLALYFPVYLAQELGLFEKNNLEVNFIATKGDRETYSSLVRGTANIGIADPIFSVIRNKTNVEGSILASFINNIPNIAISLNKNIKIDSLSDFNGYRIGTFKKFTTTHSITKFFLPDGVDIQEYDHHKLSQALLRGDIDVAITLPEFALDIPEAQRNIIYDFSHEYESFLYTGFSVIELFKDANKDDLDTFIQTVSSAVYYIQENRDESLKVFSSFFDFKNPQEIFDYYYKFWNTDMVVSKKSYDNLYTMWNKLYPLEFLKNKRERVTSDILSSINTWKYKREQPYNITSLYNNILNHIKKNEPIKFVMYWGKGERDFVGEIERQALDFLHSFFGAIQNVYPTGVHLDIIFTDTHTRINGLDGEGVQTYYESLKELAQTYNFNVHIMSDFTDLVEKEQDISLNENLLNSLVKSASQHYIGDDDIFHIANWYYRQNQQEKNTIQKKFSESIFLTYNNSEMNELFPTDLPIFYMYSIKKGDSEKPWFKK